MSAVSTGASSRASALPVMPPAMCSRLNWRKANTDCSVITMPVKAPTSSTIGRLPKPMYSAASR
jgi:hypothetical protein